jgi:hypothetical protein
VFKPIVVGVSPVFLLLLVYTFGNLWAILFPRRQWVHGTRFEWLGPVLHFINPGDFKLKEVCTSIVRQDFESTLKLFLKHVVASLVSTTAAGGSTAVQNFAVQRVNFFDVLIIPQNPIPL